MCLHLGSELLKVYTSYVMSLLIWSDGRCHMQDVMLVVPGLSHLLEYMAFKTTSNRTHFRLVREVSVLI